MNYFRTWLKCGLLRALQIAQNNPTIAAQLKKAGSFLYEGEKVERSLKSVTFLEQSDNRVVLRFDFTMLIPKYDCMVQVDMIEAEGEISIAQKFTQTTCGD